MMSHPEMSAAARRAADQAISYLMQAAFDHDDCISLAAGFVDESTLPTELVRNTAARLLTDDPDGRVLLQYGTTPGIEHLRAVFRDYLARLENRPEVRDLPLNRLMLTTGSQQMLSLLSQVLFEPGDICLVAAPTYFVYLSVLDGVGAEVIPVASDDQGMQPDALQQTLQELDTAGRLDRVRLVYAVSYYDNPGGISIAAERRPQLVQIVKQWAARSPLLLLEDAAYRELRYSGPVLPSLWSCDQEQDTVILTQTFSKTFSPGLRVGLTVLPECLVKPVADLKGNEDFGSPRLNQHIVAEVIRSGEYAQHLQAVINGYTQKRDAMLAAAEEFFAEIPGVHWERPDGGLYVWMTLPQNVHTGFNSRLFEVATQSTQVIYVPGELCYPSGWPHRPHHQMRLSFGVESPEGIREGMRRLANAVRQVLKESAE